MKTKLLLIASFFLFNNLIFGQNNFTFEKPNYNTIEKNIAKENSNLFYKKLMNRYLEADSTMTIEEKRHLYFGFTFQKEYNPYSTSDIEDSLRIYSNKEILTQDDYQQIIKFSNSLLEENPFDIRALGYKMMSCESLEMDSELIKTLTQFKTIIETIMSTGDGTSKENAFYVIFVSHEYDLIDILGFEFGGEQSLITPYDYLTLAPNEFGIEGFYFDISPSLNFLEKMFK